LACRSCLPASAIASHQPTKQPLIPRQTHQALHQWSELQQHWQRRVFGQQPSTPSSPSPPPAAAAAAEPLQLEASEQAAWLLHRLGQQHVLDSLLLEDEIQEMQRKIEGEIRSAQITLDQMADQIREEAQPGLFEPPGEATSSSSSSSSSSGSSSNASQQLEVVGKVRVTSTLLYLPQPFALLASLFGLFTPHHTTPITPTPTPAPNHHHNTQSQTHRPSSAPPLSSNRSP